MIREKDHMILNASYVTPVPHKHLALHLLFGVEDQLSCQIEGQNIVCDGICIASNVLHTASVQKGRLLMVLVETSSELAEQMRQIYLRTSGKETNFAILPENFVQHIRQSAGEKDSAGLKKCIQTLDGNYICMKQHMDERIADVLKWMEDQEGIDEHVYMKLTKLSCLSLSRLSHLFKEQTGSSLAGYLAWVKLEHAYRSVQAGNSLTQAAVNAGFSSPSHMSATFRRMFGITFSDFLASI